MRSIVVPVNFTANSANAVRYAADLALSIGANLHLINVFTLPVTLSEGPMPESVYDELRESCEELLDTLSGQITDRTNGKVKVTKEVMFDHIDRQIKQYCTANHPFLVVMGATGDSLENVLEGSHTVKALRSLRYPLLVIPERVKFKPIKKIVVACDEEDIYSGMPPALPFLDELSTLLNAHLEVVHILTKGDSASKAIADYNVWKKQVKALPAELHVIRRPTAAEGITAYLEDHPADWLMVFPKTHSMLEFHRSRAKQIVLHCSVPVLSIHE